MVTYLPPVPPKKNIWGRIGAAAGEGFEKGADEARQEALAGRKMEQEQQLAGQKRQHEMEILQRKFEYDQQLQQQKQESKLQELSGKKRETTKNFQNALDAIQQMKELGKKGNLGRGSSLSSYFSPETQYDRGAYSTLGKSLIQYASNIPIRNKTEFDVLAHDLFDPSLPDKQREGILDKMEDLINKSLQAHQGQESEQESSQTQRKKRPLSSFER